jgi:hypothetical protein
MQPPAARSPLVISALVLTILIALALELGAVQELLVRGVRGGETQPLVIGTIGALVSALVLVAAMALWRRTAGAPRLALLGAALAVAFHAYAALPPHRNVGFVALLLAVMASAVLVWVGQRQARPAKGAPAG